MKIEVIGLGAGDIEQLPLGIYETLINSKKPIFVRTDDHPVMASLQERGLKYITFDNIYEQHDTFIAVYETIVKTLLQEAKTQDIIYAVPGHPLMAEKTVQLLLEQSVIDIDILGGQSFLDPLFARLHIDPIEGFQLIDATDFSREQIRYHKHILFAQVYDAFIASEVKLTLLEDLPADYPITIVEAAGSSLEQVTTVPLVELDREVTVSNLTTLYVPPVDHDLLNHTFDYLRTIIQQLRGENGCPWDKKQTHESLRKYALEEVYELIDAINQQDDEAIIEELGDVLLQVMLHSQIGEDAGYFSIDDVMKRLSEKMIHRHPHVFHGEEVLGAQSAKQRWDALKAQERGNKNRSSILDEVILSAPSLQVAYDIQKEAAKVGFDWENVDGVWEKLTEELTEFQEAIKARNERAKELEFGDVLFVLVNLAKWYGIHPEIALHMTNEKFMSRFSFVEDAVKQDNRNLSEISDEQFEYYWQQAKKEE